MCVVLIFPRVMFAKSDRIDVLASAKVNLFLEVVGVRDNGYHELRSVVAPVSLFDEVTIENADDEIKSFLDADATVCCDELVETGSYDNLTSKAARALKNAVGYKGGARITVKKNIPIGGGMGGGSADAAAVLRGLNDLWQLGLSEVELAEIGFQVGCDVPALVFNRMVLMEGVGEKITPLSELDFEFDSFCMEDGEIAENNGLLWLVLVNPCFSVSTKDIFSRYNNSCLTSDEMFYKHLVCSLRRGSVNEIGSALFNGLAETVFRKYPQIEMLCEALDGAGALGTLVSGSGASVFGLAANEMDAWRIEREICEKFGTSVWSRVVSTLPDSVTAAQGPLTALV